MMAKMERELKMENVSFTAHKFGSESLCVLLWHYGRVT